MNRTVKRIRRAIGDYWQAVSLSIVGLVCILVIYVYKLGSLTKGVDAAEYDLHNQIVAHSLSLTDILRSPDNLLFKVGQYILQLSPFQAAGSIRMLSVVMAIGAIIAFYYIVRHWFTHRLALLTTALFATSSWLLHAGRYAQPESGYLLLVVLLAAWIWLQPRLNSRLALAVFIAICAATLYVPGMILFVLPVLVWQRHTIKHIIKNTSLAGLGLGGVFGALLLAPLLVSLVWPAEGRSLLQTVQTMIGIPNGLPGAEEFFRRLVELPTQLFARQTLLPQMGILGLPLIDFFVTIMTVIGVLISIRDWRLDRSKLLLYLLLSLWLFVAFSGSASMTVLIPVIYLFAAIGVAFMLIEWLTVFPRNPLARGVGIGLVALAVLVVISYNLRSYFVAWPQTQITKDTYSRRL